MRPPFDPFLSAAMAADVAWMSYADGATRARRRRERLVRLLDAAARGSRLYRGLIGDRDPRTLALDALPVVRKPELMAQFDAWVTDPRLTLAALRRFVADPARIGEGFEGVVAWESSGSSGEPGLFVQDASALAVYDALEALRRPTLRSLGWLLDPFGSGETMVFLGATGGHFASTVSIERLRRLNPLAAARLHSVSILQPTAQWMAQLRALAPTVIATYPSAAVLLAEARAAGELDIAPRQLWLGGETFTASMRARVQQAFPRAAVAQSYGASEFLAMAGECAAGRLHLNDDWLILEPVDASYRPVPPGTPGTTTLLTNLANHVQPLIRYELGDRVCLPAGPCTCGSPLPTIEVQGRADDTLCLRAGTRTVRLLPLAVSTVLEDEAGLFDYRLVQRSPDALELSIPRRGPQAEQALRRGREALQRFVAAQGAPQVRLRCRCGVDEPAPGRTGKRQRIVQLPDAAAPAA